MVRAPAAGAANIEGSPLFHVISGNLGYQVEHHLFPDMPSTRYAEIAPRVKDICERYGLPYNTGPFLQQLGMVQRTILRLAFPGGRPRPKPGPVPRRRGDVRARCAAATAACRRLGELGTARKRIDVRALGVERGDVLLRDALEGVDRDLAAVELQQSGRATAHEREGVEDPADRDDLLLDVEQLRPVRPSRAAPGRTRRAGAVAGCPRRAAAAQGRRARRRAGPAPSAIAFSPARVSRKGRPVQRARSRSFAGPWPAR